MWPKEPLPYSYGANKRKGRATEFKKIYSLNFGVLSQSPDQLIQVRTLMQFPKTKETYYFCLNLVVLEKWYSPASGSDDLQRDASNAE